MTGGRKALEYAEDRLGVHKVFEEAQVLAARLAELRESVVTMRADKARAEDAYQTAEYAFVSDQRAQLFEMSQTAFDKAIKAAVHNEPSLRALRADLAQRSTNLEMQEAAVSRARVDIEIATARMAELGGYFAYLAALKNAETAQKYGQQDWPSSTA